MVDVECLYCHAMNDAEERRCARCGRRLHMAAPRPAPDVYPSGFSSSQGGMTATATARAFEVFPESAPQPTQEPPQPAPERGAYQPSLFPRNATGSPKVIPIPGLTPWRPEPVESPRQRTVPNRPPAQPSRSRRSDAQQALEFHDSGGRGLAVETDVIFCDAPVAMPAHRMIAAAVDASAVLLALGVFVGVFYLGGGDMVLSRETIPVLLGAAFAIGIFYRFVWLQVNCDTPGMRFAGLTLVDFDGRTPSREQRGVRQVASLLSILSAGVGLIWALVDEENLTWHDHISKTFPTPTALLRD